MEAGVPSQIQFLDASWAEVLGQPALVSHTVAIVTEVT